MDQHDALVANAIDASSFGVVITDPSQPGNPIVFANRAFTHTTGYSEAECLGRNCRFLQGPDTDASAITRMAESVRARLPTRVVLRNYRKDGSSFWNDVSISPVFDEAGALLAFVSVQRDVSDQVAIDQAYGAIEARLRDFAVLAGDWFWERGPDHCFTYVSPAFAAAVGCADADLIGFAEAEDEHAFPDWPRLKEALQKGEPFRDLPYRMLGTDGTLRTTIVDAMPVRGEDGRLLGHRGRFAAFDGGIRLRRAGGPVAKASPRLGGGTAPEIGTGVLSPRDLAVIGRLGGGIAHDFNNLLTILHGNLQLLSLEESVQAVPDVGELIDCALSASREGACLARTLSMFAPHRPLTLVPVDVNAMIADMLPTLRLTLSAATTIALDLDPLRPLAVTDAAYLEAAIINLINNARDAMPDGGRLAIATRSGHLDGEAAVAAGLARTRHVAVSVTDSGVGMSQSVLRRAAEPLFTMKAEGKGAGLGLAMVSRLAQASKGRLELASTPGQGTTVTLIVPEAAED